MERSFRAINPGKIEMELTMRMSLKDWINLQEQLSTRHPSWDLSNQIQDMIAHAKKHFYETDKE